jgi:glyoxylase-like metal-dependent hydrolase (beta-lactamase superfamily II)
MSWNIHTLPVKGFAANCYWIENEEEAWLIDPSAKPPEDYIDKPLKGIIATHGHVDHLFSADDWREKYHIPLYIHENDAERLINSDLNYSTIFRDPRKWKEAEKLLSDGSVIKLENGYFEVMHTPGHTQGSICLFLHDFSDVVTAVFTGDTLFADNIGRTDLGGSEQDMLNSLKKIKHRLTEIPGKTMVFPGHDQHVTADWILKNNFWLINS